MGFVVHLIPHTHWDREWYLSRAAFRARLVPVLDDLLGLLRDEPAWRTFLLDGQTVLAEDYLAVRPERRELLAGLVASGRLQLGPWYVLADEQIPAGESLLRNLALGARDARRLGGRLDVLHSPDAFGHPPAWPALAAEFGIARGTLWRGRDGARDLFRWRAPDGRAVVVYHLPPDGYEVGAALPSDPGALRRAWPPLREVLAARAATPHLAVLVGADHHAARPDLVALRDALAALEPGGDVRISRLDEFLAAAEAEAHGLEEVRGELRWSRGYTWTLQGVHATRARQKRRNARLELLLTRAAEPLAALARLAGGRDRRPLLEAAWRELVRAHFHDAIGGCAADVVARAVDTRFDAVEDAGSEIVRGALHQLAGHDPDRARRDGGRPALLVWNPAARPREAVLVADTTWFREDVFIGPPSGRTPRRGTGAPAGFALRAGRALLPVQVLHVEPALERVDAAAHYPDLDRVDRVRIAVRVPARGLSLGVLEPVEHPLPAEGDVELDGARLLNARVAVSVGADGILSVEDRATGERYPGCVRLESGGDVGDTYTFCPPPDDRLHTVQGPVAWRVLAEGPLVGALELRCAVPAGRALEGGGIGEVAVRLVVALHAGSPAVRCTLELDNRAADHRLRLRCPVAVAGPARAGAAFTAVEREEVAEDPGRWPRETPVRTAPAHRWAGAGAGRRGLALIAPGFFEYEWSGGDLLMTLLRAVGRLSAPDLPTRPGHAGWPVDTPAAQCPGPDRIQFALLPLDGEPVPERLEAEWEDLFLPLEGHWIRGLSPEPVDPLGVELEGDGLVFSACHPPAEGEGLVLRCWNARSEPVRGVWRFVRPVAAAERVRADETLVERLDPADGGRAVPFTAGPGEIVTVRVG